MRKPVSCFPREKTLKVKHGSMSRIFLPGTFLLQFKSDELHLNHEGVDTAQELTVFQVIYKAVSWKAVRSEKCRSSIMSLDVGILHSAPKGNMAKV